MLYYVLINVMRQQKEKGNLVMRLPFVFLNAMRAES